MLDLVEICRPLLELLFLFFLLDHETSILLLYVSYLAFIVLGVRHKLFLAYLEVFFHPVEFVLLLVVLLIRFECDFLILQKLGLLLFHFILVGLVCAPHEELPVTVLAYLSHLVSACVFRLLRLFHCVFTDWTDSIV